MKTKEKQKRWSTFFAMVLAMIMVANMALPTVVFASGSQDKTETTSGKVTKKTATQQLDEENQKTVSVKEKVATQANEEQIVISKVDVILKITNEMEKVLENDGGGIPKEYNSETDTFGIYKHTKTIPSIMDVKLYDKYENEYSMDELNKKLENEDHSFFIAYGWMDKMNINFNNSTYEKLEYVTSILSDHPYYYFVSIENLYEYITGEGMISNYGNVIIGDSTNINVYIEKKKVDTKLSIVNYDKEGEKYGGSWKIISKLGTPNNILNLKQASMHNHSWKYKQDTQTTNKILAYCTQPEYKDGCSYQGEDHALTLDLDAKDMEYTGNEYDKASVINNISSITGATCGKIYYEGTNYESTTPPTNPGTYTASVTLGGVTATKTFTISKLDSTYTDHPTAKTLTYNGTEQELVNSGQAEHGKLWYCLKDSGTWQEGTVPKAKDAKKYTVLYYLEGDATHKDVGSKSDPAGSIEVTIEPKDITATITPNGGTYGNVTEATVALDGVVEDDKDTVSVDLRYSGQANDGSTVTESVKVPEKAGSYTVATGTVSNTNYKLKGDSKPFTIAKEKVSAPSISSKEYTGKIQTADIKETPLYEVKENKGGTEAGSYDVVLSLKDAANYTWETTEGKELKVSFIITRTSNTWKTEPSVKGWTYGESHEAPVAEPMYGKDTLVVEYRPADAEDSAYTTEEPKDAGDYKVRFTVAETKSYGSLSKVLEFTIQKASKEPPKVTAVPETVKGQGNGQITGVDSSMEYRKDGDKDHTAITGENVTGLQAGTYFVRYKESKNYNASKEAEVIIAAGTQLTITLPSSQEGYTLTVDKNTLDWHEEATLTFTLKEGYTKTEDFVVLVNGKKVELNDKNSYVIRDIETNMEVTVTGVKDTIAPTGSITIGRQKWDTFSEKITFDTFFNKKQEVVLKAEDAGSDIQEISAEDAGSDIQEISYYLSHKAMTLKEIKEVKEADWTVYSEAFFLMPDNEYVIYVKVTDKAGNITYLSSDGIVLDATPARITGIESGKAYTKSRTMKVTDKYLASVSVDGKEVTLDKDGNYTLIPKNDTYKIAATDKAGNTTTVEDVRVNWKEVKAPSVASKVYTGKNQTADISDTEEYTVAENKGGIEVGTYKVILQLKNTVDYKWQKEKAGEAKTAVSFEITKAVPKVTAPRKNMLIYNGKEQELVASGETTGGTMEYSLNGTAWSEDVPKAKNAGIYLVSYRVKGNKNFTDVKPESVSVSIGQKQVSLVWSDTEFTYNGKTQMPTAAVKGDTLAEGDSCTVTVTGGQKDAGTYTAEVTKISNSNYKLPADATTTFTIQEKEIKVTWGKTEFTYDKTAKCPAATATGLENNDTCGILVIGEAVNAGTHTATAVKTTNKNYKLSGKEAISFTIAPKEIGIRWGKTEFIYDGTAKLPVAEATGLEKGDSCTITVKGEATDAGTYTAEAVRVSNENYKLPENCKTEFIIRKATTEIINAPEAVEGLVYNGQAQKLLTAGKVKDSTFQYKIGDGEWTEEVPAAKNAGTYTISYRVMGNNNHVDSEEEQLTVTISKKDAVVTANDTKKIIGQRDPKLTYKVSGTAGNDNLAGILIYRRPGEKVGKYPILVSQKEGANPNYSITFKNGTFTIEQKDQSKLNGNAIEKLKLPLLLAKGKGGNKSITISWLRYSGASGYEAYWSYCDGKKNYKKFATVKNNKLTVTHKKLKNNRDYKYYIAAYRMENGKKIYLAKSNVLHVAMKQSKFTNAKSITLNKKKVTLKVNKTFKIQAKVKLASKKKKQMVHEKAYRYYTDNSNVATVSKKGVITAKAKGSCLIYVLTNNGVYQKIKVTVK